MTHDDLDLDFGELRSLAHHTEGVGAHVWRELLVEARRRAPQVYDARWRPYLERLALPTFTVGSAHEWDELLACLPAGVSVRFMGRADEGAVAVIAESPLSEKVTELDLDGAGIGDAGAERIATSSLPGRLIALDLRSNGITRAAIEVFTGTRWPVLERLVLGSNALDDPAVGLLARRLEAPKLAWLDLSGHAFGQAAARELERSAALRAAFVVT
jgi:hypothetical protein